MFKLRRRSFREYVRFLVSSRWLRLVLLSGFLSVGICLALAAAAVAKTESALTHLAENMLRIPDANYTLQPRRLSVNGLSLFYETGYSQRDVDEVSEHFARACRDRSGMLGDDAGQKQLRKLAQEAPGILSGVHTSESERGRVFACIDTQGVSWFGAAMLERLHAFADSGDLSALGTFRYALVKRTSYGAHFVTFWTEGAAPLLKMFPASRDVPGADHPILARVGASRRILSVSSEELRAVAFEHTRESQQAVVELYNSAIRRDTALDARILAQSDQELTAVLRKGESQAFLLVTKSSRGPIAQITDFPR
jgi:hypothetical protein